MAARKKPPRWRRSPPELAQAFDGALPDDPRIERRAMFGFPCAFTGGHLFSGLHQADILVRLDEPDREKLLSQPGARVFEPMAGRPMREYVLVPPALHADPRALRGWIARALEFTAAMPAKKSASKKKTTTKKRGTSR
ncbi:MAG TPA: TfoX/Sxy family protein [Myxococcota bacterium]|nr:TfoX/Sxy family protein [Myxococcota bacterium]